MQAIVQDSYGSADVLQLREIDKPEIGEHEVLVRVRRPASTRADWVLMTGCRSSRVRSTGCASRRTASAARTSRASSRRSAAA